MANARLQSDIGNSRNHEFKITPSHDLDTYPQWTFHFWDFSTNGRSQRLVVLRRRNENQMSRVNATPQRFESWAGNPQQQWYSFRRNKIQQQQHSTKNVNWEHAWQHLPGTSCPLEKPCGSTSDNWSAPVKMTIAWWFTTIGDYVVTIQGLAPGGPG